MPQRREVVDVVPALLLGARAPAARPEQLLSGEAGDTFCQTGKPLIASTVREVVEEEIARKMA